MNLTNRSPPTPPLFILCAAPVAPGLSDAARLELESGGIAGVSVPLERGVESLNAAVAGAIVLGEAQRQRLVAERHVGVGGGRGVTGNGELSGAVSQ